jgi:hypothetical protein
MRLKDLYEYRSYGTAKKLCNNPHAHGYKDYGGRGIEFRFASFREFIDELGTRPDYRVLGRIDKNGHFEVGNLRWATRSYNNNRRRCCRSLTIRKETRSTAEWAVIFNISKGTVRDRLLRGWSIEEAVKMKPYKGIGVNRYKISDLVEKHGGVSCRLTHDIMDVYVEALVLRDKVQEQEIDLLRLKRILREKNLITEYKLT